jgi:subtilisin family serine protease
LPSLAGYVRNEFIIVLKDTAQPLVPRRLPSGIVITGRKNFDLLSQKFGISRIRNQFPEIPKGLPVAPTRQKLARYYKITFQKGTLTRAMNACRSLPAVEHVEPIAIHTLYLEPNDPFYRDSPDTTFPFDQWHYWHPNGVDANLAWDIETGDPNVVVAVLDSGVRYFHVDLGGDNPLWGPNNPSNNGNIWVNPAEIPANGIDDDLNGYVDDTIGWDFVSSTGGFGVKCLDQDCEDVDNNPDDGDGHGTHVAGTVVAITNNDRLVAGVAGGFAGPTDPANGAKVMPLRIGYHARYQGSITGLVHMDWAAEAMTYVADQIDRNNINVVAINASWGSSNTGGLNAAVDNLLAHDVMIINAAGNSNSTTPDFLGTKNGVMKVAATDIDGQGASFTNHGTWVDLAAPGVDILSTYANPDDPNLNHHYIAVLSGTSMSAPHACGVAALLESFAQLLSAQEKFDIMVNTAEPYDDSRDLGSGILNAQKALRAAALPPDLNLDGLVDSLDLDIMLLQWLKPPAVPSADIEPQPNGDGIVNFFDFATLAEYWQNSLKLP